MNTLKKMTALLLALILVLSLAACGSTPETEGDTGETPAEVTSKIDEIKAAGVLVMGTSADYPPNEFHTEIDGVDTIVGFDVSLGQYIADDLGVELQIVDMAFDSLCISLSQGDFDIVIAGMAATEERMKSVDFTNPHFQQKTQPMLVLAENADQYKTVEDFAGKQIGVQNGTTQVPLAQELTDENKVIGLVKTQDIVMEVKAGKLDAGMMDYMATLAYAAADDALALVDVGYENKTAGQCIGVQKGNEDFVEYLNGMIADVQAQGLMEQWIAESSLLAGVE